MRPQAVVSCFFGPTAVANLKTHVGPLWRLSTWTKRCFVKFVSKCVWAACESSPWQLIANHKILSAWVSVDKTPEAISLTLKSHTYFCFSSLFACQCSIYMATTADEKNTEGFNSSSWFKWFKSIFGLFSQQCTFLTSDLLLNTFDPLELEVRQHECALIFYLNHTNRK